MSTDYANKERTFLAGLKSDTGHTLEDWLELIGAENLEERNDIIDWLRQQGFTFSWASWLERIYHNGGKPIYAKQSASGASDLSRAGTPPPAQHQPTVRHTPAGQPQTPANKDAEKGVRPPLRIVASNAGSSPPSTKTNRRKESPSDGMNETLARAKGLRPLANHLLQALQSAVPDAEARALKSAVLFSCNNMDFAILALSSKDLRLGLALAAKSPEAPFTTPQFAAAHARITEKMTHMLVLDDVRQIDAGVMALVRQAAEAARRP